MRENELFDLESKQNKAGGGYCTELPDYQSPFIFLILTVPPAMWMC